MSNTKDRDNRKAYLKKYNAHKRAKYIENNKCSRCGKDKEREDRKHCSSCIEYGIRPLREQYRTYRELVFKHYGRTCVCCGETEPAFLAIDHGPGAPSRKDNPGQRHSLSKWIVDNGYPKEFRILCHSCNMATRWGRQCPHQKDISVLVSNLPKAE